MTHILTEKRDAVGVVIIDRPEKRNAFTLSMLRALTECFGAFDDDLDAATAARMHLVQEVVEPGAQFERACAIAERIAAQPPLAVKALLDHGREALELGRRAALAHIPARGRALFMSEDAREAAKALMERRTATFHGR